MQRVWDWVWTSIRPQDTHPDSSQETEALQVLRLWKGLWTATAPQTTYQHCAQRNQGCWVPVLRQEVQSKFRYEKSRQTHPPGQSPVDTYTDHEILQEKKDKHRITCQNTKNPFIRRISLDLDYPSHPLQMHDIFWHIIDYFMKINLPFWLLVKLFDMPLKFFIFNYPSDFSCYIKPIVFERKLQI